MLDVIESRLAHITEVDARTGLFWPEIKLVDTGETSVEPPVLFAKTAIGALASVQVQADLEISQPAARDRRCDGAPSSSLKAHRLRSGDRVTGDWNATLGCPTGAPCHFRAFVQANTVQSVLPCSVAL